MRTLVAQPGQGPGAACPTKQVPRQTSLHDPCLHLWVITLQNRLQVVREAILRLEHGDLELFGKVTVRLCEDLSEAAAELQALEERLVVVIARLVRLEKACRAVKEEESIRAVKEQELVCGLCTAIAHILRYRVAGADENVDDKDHFDARHDLVRLPLPHFKTKGQVTALPEVLRTGSTEHEDHHDEEENANEKRAAVQNEVHALDGASYQCAITFVARSDMPQRGLYVLVHTIHEVAKLFMSQADAFQMKRR
eukprot:CAMPEP_0180596378 /NCGR_PEP_ID=MMETSP1037_2-20121125/21778_1 /TAXON_ID=632150 /ORGANISM="Azadinium spinosum, Strain 3D9" /LENGTH=252 /DNA_ID=CAMNT_0022614873 /DNA_START=523 /DNA_END=1282 /DNA_ORIENTATION=-